MSQLNFTASPSLQRLVNHDCARLNVNKREYCRVALVWFRGLPANIRRSYFGQRKSVLKGRKVNL